MVEELQHTGEGGFGPVLDFHFNMQFSLGDAAQVGDVLKRNLESHRVTGENGLPEPQVLDTVIDQHFHVADVSDLFPEVRDDADRKVAMRDGGFECGLTCSTLRVRVDPLVVQRGIGKLVDTFLRYGQVFRYAKFLADVC